MDMGGGERQRGGAWREVLGAANCQSIQIHRHGHRMSVPSSLFSAQWRFMLLRLRPLPSPLPRFAPLPSLCDVLVILDNGLLSARLMLDACDDWHSVTRPLIGDAHCNKQRGRERGSVCVCIGLGIRIGLPIAVAIKQRVSCKRITA